MLVQYSLTQWHTRNNITSSTPAVFTVPNLLYKVVSLDQIVLHFCIVAYPHLHVEINPSFCSLFVIFLANLSTVFNKIFVAYRLHFIIIVIILFPPPPVPPSAAAAVATTSAFSPPPPNNGKQALNQLAPSLFICCCSLQLLPYLFHIVYLCLKRSSPCVLGLPIF